MLVDRFQFRQLSRVRIFCLFARYVQRGQSHLDVEGKWVSDVSDGEERWTMGHVSSPTMADKITPYIDVLTDSYTYCGWVSSLGSLTGGAIEEVHTAALCAVLGSQEDIGWFEISVNDSL